MHDIALLIIDFIDNFFPSSRIGIILSELLLDTWDTIYKTFGDESELAHLAVVGEELFQCILGAHFEYAAHRDLSEH